MLFAKINTYAIVAAAVASFLFGGAWYGILGARWLAALGKSAADIKAAGRPVAMLLAITLVAQIVMAFVLAGVAYHGGSGQLTWRVGLISAGLIWLGFVATTLIVNHGYQGTRWTLTLIDGLHWLGVLLIQGLIIGLFGGR